jgi:ribosomal protein S27E
LRTIRTSALQVSGKCPNCGKRTLVEDSTSGELSCSNCGFVVNEKTGEVVKKDGSSTEGLYAAGRNAVGLCGNGYFASGTSIADCVFAGRRAGGHAASLPGK